MSEHQEVPVPQQPDWLPDPDTYIPGVIPFPNLELQTSMIRGADAIDTIEKYQKNIRPISVLIAGLGYNSGSLVCPCEPYQIAAYLKTNYSLTLVDKNPDVIRDIRHRRIVVFPAWIAENSPEINSYWKTYLQRTGQTASLTHTVKPGIEFTADPDRSWEDAPETLLKKGLYYADIPESFTTGLGNGTITLIRDRIETAPLPRGHFDFVACINLLYLLNEPGQMLTLANLASAIKGKGLLLLNSLDLSLPAGYDTKINAGGSVLSEQGGWLTNEKLKSLGLEMISQSYRVNSMMAVLRKK